MRITFIRHGESVANAAGIWQGQSDAPLSDLGRAQAAQVARRLAGVRGITHVLSSDLQRAHDTARAIAREHTDEVRTSPVWREIDLGGWEGLTPAQVAQRFPAETEALARGADIPVGGGESWGALRRRVRAGFEALRESLPDDAEALVVAHGGVIITLFGDLMGVHAARPRVLGKLTNTALSTLECAPHGVRVITYNDGLHVDAQATWRIEVRERSRGLLALSADPSGHDASAILPGLAAAGATAELVPCALTPGALRGWATSLLPPRRDATPAEPALGARCLATGRRPNGTLWSWNEGGLYPLAGAPPSTSPGKRRR
jgi:broad specificity phosphatase PhoE